MVRIAFYVLQFISLSLNTVSAQCSGDVCTFYSMGLTTLPPNIDSTAKTLDLDTNFLNATSLISFSSISLPLLEVLILSNNQIAVFPNLASVSGTLTQLFLKSNLLTDISTSSLNNLTVLTTLQLNDNLLTVIPDVTGMRSLLRLYVSDNDISQVVPEHICGSQLKVLALGTTPLYTFPNISCLGSTLIVLSIHHSEIPEANEKHLDTLLKLSYLNLGGNNLTQFPSVNIPDSRLRQLRVNQNQIVNVTKEYLNQFLGLKKLYLNQNLVTTLPNVCDSQLSVLDADANPLVCDKHLVWMKLFSESIGKTGLATCSQPAQLAGRTIQDVSYTEMGVYNIKRANTRNYELMISPTFNCWPPTFSVVTSLASCAVLCLSTPDCLLFGFTHHMHARVGECGVTGDTPSLPTGTLSQFQQVYAAHSLLQHY